MIEMIPVKSEQNQTKLAYLDGQLDTVGKIYVVCTLWLLLIYFRHVPALIGGDTRITPSPLTNNIGIFLFVV